MENSVKLGKEFGVRLLALEAKNSIKTDFLKRKTLRKKKQRCTSLKGRQPVEAMANSVKKKKLGKETPRTDEEKQTAIDVRR